MELRFVAPDLRRLDELRTEALSAGFMTDERPLRGALGLIDWRLAGRVSRLVQRGVASGARGESVLIPGEGKVAFDKLFLRGLGPRAAFDGEAFDEALGAMFRTMTLAGVRSSTLVLPGRALGLITPEDAIERLLRIAEHHPEHDEVTLVEGPAGQRAMEPVLLRARRAAHAFG